MQTAMQTVTVSNNSNHGSDGMGRCSEPGCVWPEHEAGLCLKCLRERADPMPFMCLEAASRYSDIGNASYAGYMKQRDIRKSEE